MSLEAVLFDWGGTLTPWHTLDPGDAWLACGYDAGEAARLFAAEGALWVRARDTQRSGTLDEVFATAGVTPGPGELAKYYAWWEEHTFTDADVKPLWEALRERGLRIGVLSNTLWPRVEHERVFRRDGVLDLLDAAVYTSEIEWTKPHPAAFRAALDAVGVSDPAAAVFVGDRPYDDIGGAKGVGMRAVLVPHSTIPDYQKGPEGTPDAVVFRLSELLPLIDSWS